MSPALFGILQLDKGEPEGYANILGLVQAWLQDAGGFAMLGLVVYLLYALATPTHKSQSEKLRVPVSMWMIAAAALSLICYALFVALWMLGRGAVPEAPLPVAGMPVVIPPAEFHRELRPLALMVAGFFALLGLSEPFVRDMVKITSRNLSVSFSGVRRVGWSFGSYIGSIYSPQRLATVFLVLGGYGLLGIGLYFAGSTRLFNIWAGWLYVVFGVFGCAILITLLFEAEGPVWAIAKLSFKDATRKQLLWLFLLLVVPFAFRNILMGKVKPVDEIRGLVGLSDAFLSLLILVVSGLVASLAIPNDIKNLNIYTIVSKPVERFELVLGRFVGYVSLFSLVLIAGSGFCLVMIINTNFSERAKEETYKARVPIRGQLQFKSRKADFEGTNVGREFDYRRYIAGHELSPQRGIWNFSKIPSNLASMPGDRVPVEFTFDIFKLTKGEQNRGAFTDFRIVTWHNGQRPPTQSEGGDWQWEDRAMLDKYNKAVADSGVNINGARPGTKAWEEVNKLAEEYGFFEVRGKEVYDYAVMGIDIPCGIFRNALKGTPPTEKYTDAAGVVKERPVPLVSIYVKCTSGGQNLGMAEPDLFLLEYEQPFELNFLKSMVGLWCRLCIFVAVAVACSTYLSGILSFLLACLIFILGYFSDFLHDVALGRNVGGGPFRSFSQIINAEQPTNPLSAGAGSKALMVGDQINSWFVRRFLQIIPDVNALSWSTYVSEGFNVNNEYLLVNLLVTFGYILPWGILAYYLMKSREVAA
jgi:hypothetical protein